MSIAIYGEVGTDYLLKGNRISYRLGGAGYYAAVAAARQNVKVKFLTVYNSKVEKYFCGACCNMGIDLSDSLDSEEFVFPQYLCRGYEQGEHKESMALMLEPYKLEFNPKLPGNCDVLLVFPIGNEIPKRLIEEAYHAGVPVLLDPKTNRKGIHQAKAILEFVTCLLVNDEELRLLTEETCEEKAIRFLYEEGVHNIIVKHGARGCSIYQESKEPVYQAAYCSEAVCQLGSGDVFAGYIASQLSSSKDIVAVIDRAQCVAAHFIEQYNVESILRNAEIDAEQKNRERVLNDLGKRIYLSAPFFSVAERLLEEQVFNALCSMGFEVYSPLRKKGILNETSSFAERKDMFHEELHEIDSSDFLVAIVDGNDMGTAFELGYAYQKGKKIFGIYTGNAPLNNMIRIGCYRISGSVEDLCNEISP